ncbi:hypothetical protein OS493_019469 [Desmophyllum pertusum]|uniref:Uncharacterized protein n=1 Tax=Desmophyllum pertusum TaxID=174260 RepID=A0A9X0D929_9CNID|nr:hypothetical protein OS493_019469 [Desmophyllum pertusum]
MTLLIALFSICAGVGTSKLQDVYVSRFGNDSNSCGSPSKPCKSIAQAVRQVDWGGSIYLNGTGTEHHPYDCSLPDYHPGIYVNKSLSMKSNYSISHVSCNGGLYFQKMPGKRQPLWFEISGIVFQQTSLKFEDCSFVKIFNCSFKGGLTPLTIYMKKISNFSLDIQGSSLFHNNSLCIKFILFDSIVNPERYVAINVTDTYFDENGIHDGELSEKGAIKLTTDVSNPVSLLYLEVFCYKVNFIGSRGSFINNNITKAVTKEIYKDVRLEYNQGVSSHFTETKAEHLVDSLYSSRAMKISATFIGVRCIQNTLLRCIAIESNEANVEIQSSQFSGQSTVNASGACLSLESNGYVSLVISDSIFTKNKAKAGGGLYVNCPYGTLRLNFTNVNFTRCSSQRYGCAILVGRPKRHPEKLHASFKNVQIKHCNCTKSNISCVSMYISFKSGTVEIDKSTWSDNLNTNGTLFVEARGSKVDVTISNSIFRNNVITHTSGAVISLKALSNHPGKANIVNSSLVNTRKRQSRAMWISPKYYIKLVNISTVYYRNGLVILLRRPTHNVVDVSIDSCKFINNIKDTYIYLRDPKSVQLIIQNSAFISSLKTEISYAIRLIIPPLNNISTSSAVIILNNNTFHSRPSSCFALFFQGKKNVTIRNTTFQNCVCFHREQWRRFPERGSSFYETSTGAMSILTSPDKYQQLGCVQLDDNNDTHPLWSYDSHVLFEDTTFSDNLGLLAGGVYISNGYTTFTRCTFQNNFGIHLAGHVYSAYGTGQVNFNNCSFINQKKQMRINKMIFDKATFLYSESGGPIHFQNTSMISTEVTEKFNFPVFETSSGGYVKMDESSTIQCSKGYKLKLINTTHFVYTEKSNHSCLVNVTVLRYSCSLCSAGFYSLQHGVSRGLTITSIFSCLECPFGANCIKRNIAAKPNFWGYRISENPPTLKFFACPEHYCKSPDSDSMNYNNCHGKRTGFLCGKCSPEYSETLSQLNAEKLLNATTTGPAELLIVGTTGNLLNKIPLIYIVVNAFNFEVRTLDKGIGCPIQGLTAVTKELLLSATVLVTIAEVVILYCIHLIFNIAMKKQRPSLLHYMAVVLEILLLGYERLAETSLKLMHCVSIGSEKRLFINGEILCWQWWQYILLAYIVVFVVPFIIVLYCGSSMLYRASISAGEFLGACIIPLPFLIYWFVKKIFKNRENNPESTQARNKDFSEILHGPFRQPADDDKGTLYWESVLIGRRFILLACHSFITNPMFRMVCITGACVLILLHHVLKNPYRESIANKAETFSLLALVMIAVINLTKATLISFGTSIDGPTKSYLETLEWAEVCAFAFVPTLLSIFVMFAIFSQLVRLLVSLAKKINRCLRWSCLSFRFTRQLERPLLEIFEGD